MLTCSKDFSLRVYRWKKAEEDSGASTGVEAKAVAGKGGEKLSTWTGATLESRYTLLGGSVAMKTQYVM